MRKKMILMVGLVASGCSTYSTDFDCPKGKGLNCASLHTVNQKVNKGELAVEEEEAETLLTSSLKSGEVTYFYPNPRKRIENQ